MKHRTYSYQELVEGAAEERRIDRFKHVCIGMAIMFIPTIVVLMTLGTIFFEGNGDVEYTVDIRPYRELTSPYKPYPKYLGQDLPQIWTVRIVDGEQFGIAEFQGFRKQGASKKQRISIAEYKQILIDSGVYKEYAWGDGSKVK
jgi:hypothetical protein